MDKKKLLLISLFALVALLAAYGLYHFFFKPAAAPPPPAEIIADVPPAGLPTAETGPAGAVLPVQPGAPTGLPQASPVARGGLTSAPALTSNLILGPGLSSDGKNLNFYDPSGAKFYRLSPDGKTLPLSNDSFYNVKNVVWSPQADKAVIEYPDGSKILYDFNKQKQATLPKHWQEFSFSSQGDKIAAKSIGISPENRWLIIADPDGSNSRVIEPMGDNADKVQVNWSPAGGVVAFSATGDPLGFGRKSIIPIGQNNENYKALIVEGLNFEPKWAPEGDKLIYSTFNSDNDYKPSIWITNAQGEEMGSGRRRLNIATWANKCSFAGNDILYCAVPNELPRGAGFVPEIANESADSLYKIDLKTGLKTLTAAPDGDYSMGNLFISSDQSVLYFTDNNTGQAHKINLK